MKALVKEYARDMAPYATLSLLQIFEKIKAIPYVPDPEGREAVHRPLYTMKEWYSETGQDCDDKAIALAAWAELNGIPWDFEIVSRGNRYHHVRAMLRISGKWWTVDPTYLRNTIFRDNFKYRKRRRFNSEQYIPGIRRLLKS